MNSNIFFIRIQKQTLWVLATFLLLLAGCEKDRVLDIEESGHSINNKILTISQAKQWWEVNKSVNFRSEDNDTILTAINVTPLWDRAVQTEYLGVEQIILVPFTWRHPTSMDERGKLILVFFQGHETQQIHVRILGYYALQSEYPRELDEFDVSDYSGYIFQIDHCGKYSNFIRIQNGIITKRYLADGDFDELDFRGGGNGRCPSAAGGNSRKPPRRWISPGSVATNGDDSDGGDNTQSGGDIEGGGSIIGPNTSVYWSGFGNFGSNNFGGGGTAGTGSTLSQYFNNQIFNQTYDPAKAQLIEQFKTNQGINLPISLLMLIINTYCFDEPESFDDCALWSMVNWIDERVDLGQRRNEIEGNPEMVESIIRLMLIAEGAGLSDDEVEYVVKEWIDNQGVYVPVKPIDWSQTNMQGRVVHLHKYLRYIQQMIDCDPRLAQPFYTMKPPLPGDNSMGVVGWFFTNVPPPGHSVTMNGVITYRFHNSGQNLAITIEWTALWNDQRFRVSSGGPVPTIDPNKSKIYYNYGDATGQNSSVVTIYLPSSSESSFLKDFKPPCRQ